MTLQESINVFRAAQAVVEAIDQEAHDRIAAAAPDKATFKRMRRLSRTARHADLVDAGMKGHAVILAPSRFSQPRPHDDEELQDIAKRNRQRRQRKLAALRAAKTPAKSQPVQVDPNPTMVQTSSGARPRVINPLHPHYGR